MLRFLTAGESHGRCLAAILEGIPAGLKINAYEINTELQRRQEGHGRGKRMQIEQDSALILSGLRRGVTIGSPICLMIKNTDSRINELPDVVSPRPGHADLAGVLKYGFQDARPVLERASARETAARTAAGALCKLLLREFDINVSSRVVEVGGESDKDKMKKRIDAAVKKRDTVGGVFEVKAIGLPPGLGSYAHFDRRLDGRLSAALMSIPGVKSVEIGLGLGYADKFGSEAHDAIFYSQKKGFYRKANNAGGLEGGMTNGEPLILRCCMKPISTLLDPLPSVDLNTRKPKKAAVERSDTCAVLSAGVVGEAVSAIELAGALLEKFGGDSLSDIKDSYKNYLKRIS